MCGKVPKNKKTFSVQILRISTKSCYFLITIIVLINAKREKSIQEHYTQKKQNLRGESHMDYILIALNFRFIYF